MSPNDHSTRKRAAWQEAIFAAVAFLVLSGIVFWPQIGQGHGLFWGDNGLYFTPLLEFICGQMRQGRLPLWNPYLLCGTPLVGNPQAWPFYPFSMLLPPLGAGAFVNATVAFHCALAGWGTWLFLRRTQKASGFASLLGGAAFGFGGQFVSKEQFPNMVQAMAFLPLALYAVHVLCRKRDTESAIWLGTVLGLQLLAAHAQMTLLTVYLCVAYGVFLLGRPTKKDVRVLLPRLLLTGFVATGLSAVQVLPDAAMLHDAARQHLTFSIVDRFYLPVNQLANWTLPFLHGSPLEGNFTGRGNFWETCCYVGWVPLALAIAGTWAGRWEASARFWVVTFLVSVWLSTGGPGGLYFPAYHVLPGLAAFHDPARCLFVAAWALCVLAARGLDALLWHLPQGRGLAALLLTAFAFADLAHFDRHLYPLTAPAALHPTPPALTTVLADPDIASGKARVLSPDTARVWQRFTGHRSYRTDAPGYQSLWVGTLTPNLPFGYGIRDAFGYEPVARRDAQTSVLSAVDGLRNATQTTQLNALSVKYVVLHRTIPPVLPGFSLVRTDSTLPLPGQTHDPLRGLLYLNKRWKPRARVAGGTARLRRDEPDTITIETDCPHPSTLIFADTLAPGWRARLDGRSVPLLSVNGFLREVVLPRGGRHTVTYFYRPVQFTLGLYLSLITLAVLAGRWAAKKVRAEQKTGKEKAGVMSN